ANDNNIKAVYNLRKNAQFSKINTLREIISMDLAFFQKMFPVIMVDPDTCSAIFPLKEGIFDLVVFDEASQLKLEEVLPSLIRGKYKIISGDIHQMPPSNYFGAELERDPNAQDNEIDEESLYLADSESLLDFVNNLKEDTVMSYLDFHYRSKNPKLINFSNAAFYDSRLIPMPAKVEYIPINYYQINGEYKERKNISEADKIIEMIFSDEILIDGKVPGIGIVTLNQEQKDFINKRINKFLSENNDEKIKTRYNDLVEANMFVKNLENVQGDERDIMILSTTFGKTSEGRFIQNFGPVNNQTKGYRLLNVLVTRAKYKFIVLTSIPEENIQGWEKEIQSQGNNGKAVFYAYLAYAKAVSENNSETEARILNVLSKNKFTQNDSNAVYSSSNNSNIMRILKEKKLVSETDEVIKNYKIGGFNLDYAIRKQGEEKPKVVIDININDSFSQENVSYKAIIYRRNMFKNMGYEYHLLNATEYI
ncbi:MAG: DEAD/DEAH box helicase, partial [Leptotrichiaceae bacterium]